MTPELIETFKRTVIFGKRCSTWEGRNYALDLSREEITEDYHVTMPRHEGGIISLTEYHDRGCRGWELTPESPHYSAFIAMSSMRESRKA